MSESDRSFDDAVSTLRLRLRRRSPYFATLSMYARIEPSDAIDVAATDGENIYLNPDRFFGYSMEYQEGIFLHEVLHAALLHIPRRGVREPLLWNIAADIVVNGMVVDAGMSIPRGGVRDEDLETLPVEEVYDLLLDRVEIVELPERLVDLRAELGREEGAGSGGESLEETELGAAEMERMRTYWKQAQEQAQAAVRIAQQGSVPAGFEREFGQVGDPELNWRRLLWRYLVRTPTDFEGFDRRFVSRGLYLDRLDGRTLKVYVAVDTSGSVSAGQMTDLLSEVQGILRSYPHIEVQLYYADAALYGPHELTADSEIPSPVGGGGTDFRPFFREIEEEAKGIEPAVAVYMTDGFGEFPTRTPRMPVVWAITPGGLESSEFPFGKKMRLVGVGR